MSWIDLEIGILQEFQEAQRAGRRRSQQRSIEAWVVAAEIRRRETQRLSYAYNCHKYLRKLWEARRALRLAKHGMASPCLWCGAQVPIGRYGTIPVYCNAKCCMRASNARTKERLKLAVRERRQRIVATRPPCAECGGQIATDKNIRTKFCSAKCKNDASSRAWAERQGRPKAKRVLITIDGETRTLAEWCRVYGRHKATVGNRIRDGWTPRAALETPSLSRQECGRARLRKVSRAA